MLERSRVSSLLVLALLDLRAENRFELRLVIGGVLSRQQEFGAFLGTRIVSVTIEDPGTRKCPGTSARISLFLHDLNSCLLVLKPVACWPETAFWRLADRLGEVQRKSDLAWP